MGKNIFISKKIEKLTKANKKEIFLMLDLVAYLTIKKEISLQDATKYSNILFNILE